jgi:hypothetical protein
MYKVGCTFLMHSNQVKLGELFQFIQINIAVHILCQF